MYTLDGLVKVDSSDFKYFVGKRVFKFSERPTCVKNSLKRIL